MYNVWEPRTWALDRVRAAPRRECVVPRESVDPAAEGGLRPAVVLVDDETHILDALRRLLRREPYDILATECPRQALSWVKERPVRLVVADQRMPDMPGTELLADVERVSPSTARVLLTGYPGITIKMESLTRGIFHVFYKPWNDDTLRRTIRRLVGHRAADRSGGTPS